MKSNQKIKEMAGVAILTAVAVVLQIIANYIQIGTVSINLSLIPIAISAIVYGPFNGGFVGAVVGLVILSAPSTGFFFAHNAWATVLLCILKTGLAGIASGYLFKLLKRVNFSLSIVTSSLIIPIVNTLLFFIGVIIFFLPLYGSDSNEAIKILLGTILTTNFLIEVIITSVLSPTIIYLVKMLDKKFNLNIK